MRTQRGNYLDTATNYVQVFDIRTAPFEGWPAIGICLTLAGAFTAMVIYERRTHTGQFSLPKWMHWILPAFPLTGMMFVVGSLLVGQAQLESAFREGKVRYVDGPVLNYETNQKGEWFDVDGRHFELDPYGLRPGFKANAELGGPIRPGLQIKVGYVEDTIVWLGISK